MTHTSTTVEKLSWNRFCNSLNRHNLPKNRRKSLFFSCCVTLLNPIFFNVNMLFFVFKTLLFGFCKFGCCWWAERICVDEFLARMLLLLQFVIEEFVVDYVFVIVLFYMEGIDMLSWRRSIIVYYDVEEEGGGGALG